MEKARGISARQLRRTFWDKAVATHVEPVASLCRRAADVACLREVAVLGLDTEAHATLRKYWLEIELKAMCPWSGDDSAGLGFVANAKHGGA